MKRSRRYILALVAIALAVTWFGRLRSTQVSEAERPFVGDWYYSPEEGIVYHLTLREDGTASYIRRSFEIETGLRWQLETVDWLDSPGTLLRVVECGSIVDFSQPFSSQVNDITTFVHGLWNGQVTRPVNRELRFVPEIDGDKVCMRDVPFCGMSRPETYCRTLDAALARSEARRERQRQEAIRRRNFDAKLASIDEELNRVLEAEPIDEARALALFAEIDRCREDFESNRP